MIYINSINLKEAIKAVIKSASRDDVGLCCVNFNNRSNIFTVMASRTTGFSMFRVMDQETLKLLKLWGGEFSKSISIVDAKTLLKNLKGLNTKVSITFNESGINFEFNGNGYSFTVLETSFPRLDQLYPNTFRTSFEFDRVSFLRILKSLKNDIDSKVKIKRVHMEVANEIKLSAPDARTETRVSYLSLSGARQSVTLNIDDLINILSSVQFETLTLGMNNERSPIVISSPNKIFNGVVMCNAPGIFTGVSMPCQDQV